MSSPLHAHLDRPESDFIADDLTPEQHAQCDDIVATLPPTTTTRLPDGVLISLLCGSITGAEDKSIQDKFKLSYIDSKSDRYTHVVIDDYPWLPEFMRQEWEENKSWKQVRLLKIIRSEPEPNLKPSDSGESHISDRQHMLDASHLGFKETFVGDAHIWLLNAIDAITPSEQARLYNRSAVIIQSSGMGKSRVVDEAARIRFTIPINLRAEDADGRAYPPADSDVRLYLREQNLSNIEMTRRHMLFLIVLFQKVTELIPTVRQQSSKPLAEAWHDYMWEGAEADVNGRQRTSLYKGVVEQARRRVLTFEQLPEKAKEEADAAEAAVKAAEAAAATEAENTQEAEMVPEAEVSSGAADASEAEGVSEADDMPMGEDNAQESEDSSEVGGTPEADDVPMGEGNVQEVENVLPPMKVQAIEKSSLNKSLQRLLSATCRAFVHALGSDPLAMVCFDEADELVAKLDKSREERIEMQRSSYHNLGSVLREIRDQRIIFIFMSTNSSLQALAPPGYKIPSARAWHNIYLPAPFTELPLDVFARGLHTEYQAKAKVTFGKVCTLEVMCRFGRPLWWPQYKNGEGPVPQEMVGFASGKLAPGLKPPPEASSVNAAADSGPMVIDAADGTIISTAPLGVDSAKNDAFIGAVEHRKFEIWCHENKDALFAALAVRVMLEFTSSSNTSLEFQREAESKQVESHMRVVFAVPAHREFMHTGTPSDPLLAEAAGQLLNSYPGFTIDSVAPIVLTDATNKSFSTRGERGECVGRVLWTAAHDKVAIKNHANKTNVGKGGPVSIHQPINVVAWLMALLDKKWHTVVRDACPAGNPNGPNLADAFKDAYLHFSHFVAVGESDVLTVENLAKSLFRGMALQCREGQKDIDLLAAIAFGKPGQAPADIEFSEERTSLVQGQIKNRNDLTAFLVNPAVVEGIELPVLSLVFQLGSKENKVEAATCKTHGLRSGADSPHKNHYQIVIHGASHKTYGVIPPEMGYQYRAILAASKPLKDFARGGLPGNLEGLQRQLPYIGKGRASWDWHS